MSRGADKTNKNFTIKAMQFNIDSTILAVAQSDCIIFGYKIGKEFGQKKSICTKILIQYPITTLIWPQSSLMDLYFGSTEGTIKSGNIQVHKSNSLYKTQSYVISLQMDSNQKLLISAHLDCSIYTFDIQSKNYKRIITHNCIPWGITVGKHIILAG